MILEFFFVAFVALAVFFALCALREIIIRHFIAECCVELPEEDQPKGR